MADSVLIVDDNPGNMTLASFLLEKRGYQVKTADGAAAALELLQTFTPKLILMDLQMPGVDGFELTRMLKAAPETKDIVIIAVTAYAMTGDEQRALAAGCDGYITKPIDTRTLPEVIAGHLAARR
jgi:CheY-like chemotaxis protein